MLVLPVLPGETIVVLPVLPGVVVVVVPVVLPGVTTSITLLLVPDGEVLVPPGPTIPLVEPVLVFVLVELFGVMMLVLPPGVAESLVFPVRQIPEALKL